MGAAGRLGRADPHLAQGTCWWRGWADFIAQDGRRTAKTQQMHKQQVAKHLGAPTWTACRLWNCLAVGLSPDSYSGTWPYCSLAPCSDSRNKCTGGRCGRKQVPPA